MEYEKRMANNYEIKHAIKIGTQEIVFGEDTNEPNGFHYLVGTCVTNDLFQSYEDCMAGDEYLGMMEVFVARVSAEIGALRKEMEVTKEIDSPITKDMCILDDSNKDDILNKLIACKAEALRPEYRRATKQLYIVEGGFGAYANSRGTSVFCKNLYSGERSCFRRMDVLGEVKPECLPDWARDKLHAEKEKPSKSKKKKEVER